MPREDVLIHTVDKSTVEVEQESAFGDHDSTLLGITGEYSNAGGALVARASPEVGMSKDSTSSRASDKKSDKKDDTNGQNTGISNRESARDERSDRIAHPPVDTSSPPPEDAAGNVGEQPVEDYSDRQTSHKAGSRSIAQKEAESRYPDRSMPASRKVAGAFGKEPGDTSGKAEPE
jgi:hypothetical protein